MKKLMIPVVLSALIFISCSSSGFESDVRKMARYTCELQQLTAKAMTGDKDAEKELEEKSKEAEEFSKKMKDKYKGKESDQEMNDKAEKIFEEEMKNCKSEN